jgi:hypothetical protein
MGSKAASLADVFASEKPMVMMLLCIVFKIGS